MKTMQYFSILDFLSKPCNILVFFFFLYENHAIKKKMFYMPKKRRKRSFQQGQVDETIRSSTSCLSEITLLAAAFIFPQVIS